MTTKITRLYAPLYNWLMENVNEACQEQLTGPDSDKAMEAWLLSLDDDGHIEISAQHSLTGRPETATFPQYAADISEAE